jgi:3-hydroxyacyl-[acyl-carrier-protein] dehydratase
MDEGTGGVADIAEIMRLLPHRYPFLMIDRVIDMRADEHAVGIKNVTFDEPFLVHYPNKIPIMPGVLMIEGMAQTIGVLCLRSIPASERPRSLFFVTMDKVKFREGAVPGDTLEYHVDKIMRCSSVGRYRGEAKVGRKLIAEAEVGLFIPLGHSDAPPLSTALDRQGKRGIVPGLRRAGPSSRLLLLRGRTQPARQFAAADPGRSPAHRHERRQVADGAAACVAGHRPAAT